MRLFATGAMNWVMGKALPDDVPIEAKMVTKAIERAQNTVEQRNAEIRKNVLKYDEVMNEQRKVIYKRRDQILDGADLREEAMEYLAEAVDGVDRHVLRRATSPRSGTSRACCPRCQRSGRSQATVDQTSTTAPVDRRALRAADGRGHGVLRGSARPSSAPRRCARSSARSCCRSSTSAGASTSTRWTTSRRASTCGPWARRIRWSSGSARASRCSASMMDAIAQDFVKYVMHAAGGRRRADADRGRAAQRAVLGAERPVRGAAAPWPPRPGLQAAARGRRAARPSWSSRRARGQHAGGQVRVGQDGPQRPVPVRVGQEVQAVPRRAERRDAAADPCVTSPTTWPRCGVASTRRRATCASTSCAHRGPSSRPRRRAPISGTTRTWPARSTASWPRSARTSTCSTGWPARIDDAETLFELAREEGDDSVERRARASRSRPLGRAFDELELRSLFTGEYDERRRDLRDPVGRGRGRRAGLGQHAAAHVPALGRAARASTSSSTRCRPGSEAGISSATFLVQGRHAYGRLRSEHGVHRLVRISPFNAQGKRQTAFAALKVTPFLEDVARHRDRREGPAHRHLPLVGRGWPARQRDRLGGAHHPPADRHRGVVPERAQPAPEQGPGHADPQGQAGRAPARGARGRARRHPGRAALGRLRQPDPLLRAAAVPDGQGPAHRATRPATWTGCSTAISTRSWRPTCAGCGPSARREPIESPSWPAELSGRPAPGGVPTGPGPLVT